MFETPTIARLKVTLDEIEPPIWRRLLVERKATLADLHHIIQAAFGWQDYHLHQFEIGGLLFGDPEILNEDAHGTDARAIPEKSLRLSDFARDTPPFAYLYDFGDDWKHVIEIEALEMPREGQRYPVCIDGARAAPPEDSGGPHRYPDFLAILADPEHSEHADTRVWAGKFDPERFDVAKVDRAVKGAVRKAKRRA